MRRPTREIKVGSVAVGANNPVAVQSMTNTDPRDTQATIEQTRKLAEAGCEIIRVAVPDAEAAKALIEIKKNTPIPVMQIFTLIID